MDWGEPSCWACRSFDGSLDMDVSNLRLTEIFKTWNNNNYLQKCHIIPKALGGCNCEANLVLCYNCHKASPDTRDPVHFLNWVKNKKKVVFEEIAQAMRLLEYKAEENDWKLLISKEFKKYYRENTVLVGGIVPISSFIACFIEYKKQHSEK